jgi:hypothetical protein
MSPAPRFAIASVFRSFGRQAALLLSMAIVRLVIARIFGSERERDLPIMIPLEATLIVQFCAHIEVTDQQLRRVVGVA